jgi:hypothetical protein
MSVVYFSSYKDSAENYLSLLGPGHSLRYNPELKRWEIIKERGVPGYITPVPIVRPPPVVIRPPPPPPAKPPVFPKSLPKEVVDTLNDLVDETAKDGLERSVALCVRDGELKAEERCVGDACSVTPRDCVAAKQIGDFHTHPTMPPTPSFADTYHKIYENYYNEDYKINIIGSELSKYFLAFAPKRRFSKERANEIYKEYEKDKEAPAPPWFKDEFEVAFYDRWGNKVDLPLEEAAKVLVADYLKIISDAAAKKAKLRMPEEKEWMEPTKFVETHKDVLCKRCRNILGEEGFNACVKVLTEAARGWR